VAIQLQELSTPRPGCVGDGFWRRLKRGGVHGRLDLSELSQAQGREEHRHHAQYEGQSFCHRVLLAENTSTTCKNRGVCRCRQSWGSAIEVSCPPHAQPNTPPHAPFQQRFPNSRKRFRASTNAISRSASLEQATTAEPRSMMRRMRSGEIDRFSGFLGDVFV